MRCTKHILVVTSFLAAAPVSAQTVDVVRGMSIGSGYDALNDRVLPRCVAGQTEDDRPPASRYDFDWDEVTEIDDVTRTLRMDANLSYRSIGTRGDGRVRYLSNFTSSRSEATVIASMSVETGTTHYRNARLTPRFERLSGRNVTAFREQCGTHYVAALVNGGEFNVVMRQSVLSEDEREEFLAAASGTTGSVGATVEAETGLSRYRLRSRVNIRGSVLGGEEEQITADTIHTRFNSFRREVGTEGRERPISAVLARYPIDIPRFATADAALTDAGRLLAQVTDYRSRLNAVLSTPAAYFVDPQALQSTAFRITQRLTQMTDQLRAQMERCSRNIARRPADCDFSRFPNAINVTEGLPLLYRSTCSSEWTPPPIQGDFNVLNHGAGDGSMGGGDTLAIRTVFNGSARDTLDQETEVAIFEQQGDHTNFNRTVRRRLMDATNATTRGGCFLTQGVELAGQRVFQLFSSHQVNNWAWVNLDTQYIRRASCRSNQDREDHGYVGCQTIEFLPIQLPLDHSERFEDVAPPPLTAPSWLTT